MNALDSSSADVASGSVEESRAREVLPQHGVESSVSAHSTSTDPFARHKQAERRARAFKDHRNRIWEATGIFLERPSELWDSKEVTVGENEAQVFEITRLRSEVEVLTEALRNAVSQLCNRRTHD